ncbi:hypothetical protein AB1N83_013267 [Pleurotus pulmonarius]
MFCVLSSMGLFLSNCRSSKSFSERAHQGSVQQRTGPLRQGEIINKECSCAIKPDDTVMQHHGRVVPHGGGPIREDRAQPGTVHDGAVERELRPPSLYSNMGQRARSQGHQGVDSDTVGDQCPSIQYEGYISSYVNQCPFHLFDTQRQRNITHSELKDDIAAALRQWIRMPLGCSEVMAIIADFTRSKSESDEKLELIRPYVFAAMTKNHPVDDEIRFLSALDDQLQAYNSICMTEYIFLDITPLDINPILVSVCELINIKRTSQQISTHLLCEQIALFGQYAVLSHRWCQDQQELSFDDIVNISSQAMREKKGFKKLAGFSKVVEYYYGCRYLWMDSACIDEVDRNASIPLMFGWYRHAYACVIYLATSSSVSEDSWSSRGWTFQEFLAASRIKCFGRHWQPLVCGFEGDMVSQMKFDACRGSHNYDPVFYDLSLATGEVGWEEYTSGARDAFFMFRAMASRETLKPEDMVYSLISALNLNLSLEYGEGLEIAFRRLQVAILTQTHYRHILSWWGNVDVSSRYNSMLANSFTAFARKSWYGWKQDKKPGDVYPKRAISGNCFDPTITFDSNGVMRIMVSLYSLHGLPESDVFALMGTDIYYGKRIGIRLRRLPGPLAVYQRVDLHQCDRGTISMEKPAEWVYIK